MDHDELWPGGPRLRRGPGQAPGTDSMLLYDFASKIKAGRIIDLGCGSGILTLLFAFSRPEAEVVGLELSPELADCCRDNIAINALPNARVITADLRDCKDLFKAGSFDLVVSNPPYFPQNSGKPSGLALRAQSRDERGCTLSELCAASSYLCRFGGAVAIVHRPERLAELFALMSAAKTEPKRLRFAQHRQVEPPNLVLVEGRRGGAAGLKIEAPFIISENDRDSDEVMRICHRGKYA